MPGEAPPYPLDWTNGWVVFGGELETIPGNRFKDPAAVEMVGFFYDHDAAKAAWKGRAQQTVDNAHMRFFVMPV